MTYAYTQIRPTHLVHHPGGSWTACGLPGPQHRALRITTDRARVNCKRCRTWIAKQGGTTGRLRPSPKNVTPIDTKENR